MKEMLGLEAEHLVTFGFVIVFGWWIQHVFKKYMESLESIPLIVSDLRKIAEDLKESKIQLSQIPIINSKIDTAFRRIDEIRASGNDCEAKTKLNLERMEARVEYIEKKLAELMDKT